MAGGTGFEPATTSLGGCIDWQNFRDWLTQKYSKQWASNTFWYAKKYHSMLNGSLRDLDTFSKSKKNNVLKALIALSKYLGVYEQFKLRKANHGIKWEKQDALESFLRIINSKEDDLMKWVNTCISVLDESKATFIKFVMLSGLRKSEAIKSFNMVIKLHETGKLNEYYNEELESLEHFKYSDEFLRRTKNAFFSFIPKRFIEHITTCQPISYESLRKQLNRKGLKVKLNKLRDYYGTCLVYNDIIKEEVDLLQGRIGKSIFMRHYFSPNVKDLRDRVLKALNRMIEEYLKEG